MENLKLKIKLGIIVGIYCIITILNDSLQLFSKEVKVNNLINRGAELTVLLYIIFLIISSYSTIKSNKKGEDKNE